MAAKTQGWPIEQWSPRARCISALRRVRQRSKEYVAYKEKNGGVDPFGPSGQPHIEVDFVPMFSQPFQWHFPTPPAGDWLTVIVDLMRPLSTNGWVKLSSTDLLGDAEMNINFFSNKLDPIALWEGIRWVDDIVISGEGMKDIVGADYPFPMPRSSDEAMNKTILERSQTGFRKFVPALHQVMLMRRRTLRHLPSLEGH